MRSIVLGSAKCYSDWCSMDFKTPASEESIQKTVDSLTAKGYEALVVDNGADALAKIKELIPPAASVNNGSSVTLEQIGYADYIKSGTHPWNDLHKAIDAEQDQAKRQELRRQAELADYYLGSVHALTVTGEFVVGSNTASQLPMVVYTANNLIFVVSTKKIVPDLASAMERLEKFVVPLEDEHMMKLYGSGTHLNKIVIFKGESEYSSRKIRFILIKEDLGF